MYFGFMPGCTTKDAVFIFRQLSSSVIGKALNIKEGLVLPFCTFRELLTEFKGMLFGGFKKTMCRRAVG